MNRRILLWVLALVVTGGSILFWLLQVWSPRAQTIANVTHAVGPSSSALLAQASPEPSQSPGGPYRSSDPRWPEVNKLDKLDSAWEWKMPINFYGRVLDEREQPVPGARVHAEWSDLSRNGASSEELQTDSEGLFAITGKTGRGITVRITKDGYYTPKQQISFDYAAFWEANYHKANPTTPVVFHLRTKTANLALTYRETTATLSPVGAPANLDLLNGGRPSIDGQLTLAAVTNTEKYPPSRFDWQASISVKDGGLVEHDLEFPFEAPAKGYVPRVDFDMSAAQPDWKRGVEKHYFIRFGTPPKYGRIRVRFNGASQKVSLDYVVNPTGSRDLEAKTEGEK
jgi:hypothetical protein